jgi:hypothetical protein
LVLLIPAGASAQRLAASAQRLAIVQPTTTVLARRT